MTDNDTDIEQLVENKVEEKLQNKYAVTDPDGREADVGMLQDKLGMTRRQALQAVGLVAAGMSLPVAATKAVETAQAQSNNNILTGIQQIGTSSNPISDVYVDNLTNYTQSETFDNLTVNNSADVSSLSADEVDTGRVVNGDGLDGETKNVGTTISDGSDELVDPNEGQFVGLVYVDRGDTGTSALFFLRGGAGSVDKVLDPGGDFSTTQGNAGTVNVHHDGAGYRIENQTGDSRGINRWIFQR